MQSLQPQQDTQTKLGYKKIFGIPYARTITYGDIGNDTVTPPGQPEIAPKQPVATPNPDDAIYQRASDVTKLKYGVNVPPYVLKAIRNQESSNKINESNYRLSMGLTDTVPATLGKDYLPDTSLQNSIQNASNFLAKKSVHTYPDGTKKNMATPENYGKWYLEKYVGLFPGESRTINGQEVTYEQIMKQFTDRLNQAQTPTTTPQISSSVPGRGL